MSLKLTLWSFQARNDGDDDDDTEFPPMEATAVRVIIHCELFTSVSGGDAPTRDGWNTDDDDLTFHIISSH